MLKITYYHKSHIFSQNKKYNISGFTLAESVVGILLLGALITIIGGVFISGVSSSKKSMKKVTNAILAESMMDNIMMMKFGNVPAGTYDGTLPDAAFSNSDGTKFPPLPYPRETDSSANGKNYFYKVEVKPFGATATGLKRIIVTVISKGKTGEPDTKVTLESLKVQ